MVMSIIFRCLQVDGIDTCRTYRNLANTKTPENGYVTSDAPIRTALLKEIPV
jgi:hypothetical protein